MKGFLARARDHKQGHHREICEAHPSKTPFSSLTPASWAQSVHRDTAIFRFTPTPKLRGPLLKGSSLGSRGGSEGPPPVAELEEAARLCPGCFQAEEKASLDAGENPPTASPAHTVTHIKGFSTLVMIKMYALPLSKQAAEPSKFDHLVCSGSHTRNVPSEADVCTTKLATMVL